VIFTEKYRLWSPSLCDFLHPYVTSFVLGSNTLLSPLFSNFLNLCSPVRVKVQVSQTYKTTGIKVWSLSWVWDECYQLSICNYYYVWRDCITSLYVITKLPSLQRPPEFSSRSATAFQCHQHWNSWTFNCQHYVLSDAHALQQHLHFTTVCSMVTINGINFTVSRVGQYWQRVHCTSRMLDA